MARWQFLVLFWVAVLGAVLVFFADEFGIELDTVRLSGLGAITTYVLTTDRFTRVLRKKKGDDDDDDRPQHRAER